jgi:hypothetical protein
LMQVSTESEQDRSVSCLNCFLPMTFADNCQIQHSGSGFFPNAQNTLITGGNFVVSPCALYKR